MGLKHPLLRWEYIVEGDLRLEISRKSNGMERGESYSVFE
jgi:hypothetical protein